LRHDHVHFPALLKTGQTTFFQTPFACLAAGKNMVCPLRRAARIQASPDFRDDARDRGHDRVLELSAAGSGTCGVVIRTIGPLSAPKFLPG